MLGCNPAHAGKSKETVVLINEALFLDITIFRRKAPFRLFLFKSLLPITVNGIRNHGLSLKDLMNRND